MKTDKLKEFKNRISSKKRIARMKIGIAAKQHGSEVILKVIEDLRDGKTIEEVGAAYSISNDEITMIEESLQIIDGKK